LATAARTATPYVSLDRRTMATPLYQRHPIA
jgi:hypothetical protein